jgi:adenylate kinase
MIVMGKSGSGKQPRIDVLTEAFHLKQLSTGDIFRKYLGLFDRLCNPSDPAEFYNPKTDDFISDEETKKILGIADRDDADDIVLGMKASYFVNQGLFVPDPITNSIFHSEFRSLGFRGVVLDGYPRTIDQAMFLVDLAKRENVKLDAIVLVENEDELIIARTVGRRICRNCNELYHMEYRPPPKSGTCKHKSGSVDCDIIQRSDDTVESIKARLNEFAVKTQPAIDYLQRQGIPVYRVPGNLPDYKPETVRASVFEALKLNDDDLPPTMSC